MTSKFITIIRPPFMTFCKDACRAASLNHLLFRIAGKSKDQPKEKIQAGDILWYAKTEQITDEMSNAWGVCKVRKEVNQLISMGVIGRRFNPNWGADRTKHFCFGTEQCIVFLKLCAEQNICVVHLDLPPEVMHLIYSSNANDTSIKCICSIHQMEAMDISDAFDRCITAIPIDSPTIDDYKDNNREEGTGAFAQTPPLLPSNVTLLSESAKHLAMKVATSTPHAQTVNDAACPAVPEWESDEMASTAKVPAMPKGGSNGQLASVTQPAETVRGVIPGGAAPSPPTGTLSPCVGSEPRAPGARNNVRAFTPPTRPKPKPNERPQLTLEGEQIKSHIECIQASTISRSYGNIRACNALGARPDVTFDSLKATIEHLESLKFVQEKGIAIDVQMLANDESRLNFEKNWPVARKKRAGQNGHSNTLADGKTDLRYAI